MPAARNVAAKNKTAEKPAKNTPRIVHMRIDPQGVLSALRSVFLIDANQAYMGMRCGFQHLSHDDIVDLLEGRSDITARGKKVVSKKEAEAWWARVQERYALVFRDARAVSWMVVGTLKGTALVSQCGSTDAAVLMARARRVAQTMGGGSPVHVVPVGKSFCVLRACGPRPWWWNSQELRSLERDDLSREAEAAMKQIDEIVLDEDEEDGPMLNGRGVDDDDEADSIPRRDSQGDEAYESRLEAYRAAVVKQAGDDWIPLRDRSGEELARVPRAPFVLWARALLANKLSRRSEDLDDTGMPTWAPVCPPGLKMQNDSPFHSDWMLGGGIDFDEFYRTGSRVSAAAFEQAFRLQRDIIRGRRATSSRGSVDVTVLNNAGVMTGVIGKSIAVLPHLGVEFEKEFYAADAIITAEGGVLAHLGQLAIEKGKTVVRHPRARELFEEGETVRVDPDAAQVIR